MTFISIQTQLVVEHMDKQDMSSTVFEWVNLETWFKKQPLVLPWDYK